MKRKLKMPKDTFYRLCQELQPFIQRQTTTMRSLAGVERQVAITLYYLSDEGWLRKTANAVDLSRPCTCISVIVLHVACALAVHLGPNFL